MSIRARSAVYGVAAVVFAFAVLLVTVSLAGPSEFASGPWAVVPVESEYGYAYLYNRSTGEVWQLKDDTKELVVERTQAEPTGSE